MNLNRHFKVLSLAQSGHNGNRASMKPIYFACGEPATSDWHLSASSFSIQGNAFASDKNMGGKQINTHLTPAEKLTTGKKSPSVLKFSNMPWTGCPLILKEMLGAPRSRQQLTTSSDVRMCWFRDATAREIRPV